MARKGKEEVVMDVGGISEDRMWKCAIIVNNLFTYNLLNAIIEASLSMRKSDC